MTDAGVFFVDDEDVLREAADQTFDLAGIPCQCFPTANAAVQSLTRDFDGAIVTDIRMPGMDGTEFLAQVMRLDPDIPVILVTGHGDVDLAVGCIKKGAYDFLEKPCEPARLVATVERAMERRRLILENRRLREQISPAHVIDDRLTGRSSTMQHFRKQLRAVADTDADALILGDTGTGKEVAARALHAASARAERPFVHVNCAALPAALIESELFGSEPGAFPGAMRARVGRLEHARRGTLCLDEIDTLSLPLQAKLLQVLDSREVTRLGSNDPIPLELRVIALSKVDLEKAVEHGSFRSDLLYRLNVVILQMPPVAARREDVPSLFATLAADVAKRHDRDVPELDPDHLTALAARDWPGNVREIRNVAERFVLGLGDNEGPAQNETLADRMAAHEKSLIAAALHVHSGRLKDTHESLGVSRKTLYEKMQRHGLSRETSEPES
ncbi:MAG: sigma-54 dependent transcriptional regulator [Marinovum sp.]|nr:sigma-54 dependent transcriptional regulator [Marinovum sp.]